MLRISFNNLSVEAPSELSDALEALYPPRLGRPSIPPK
jgi:hypothetical protein